MFAVDIQKYKLVGEEHREGDHHHQIHTDEPGHGGQGLRLRLNNGHQEAEQEQPGGAVWHQVSHNNELQVWHEKNVHIVHIGLRELTGRFLHRYMH